MNKKLMVGVFCVGMVAGAQAGLPGYREAAGIESAVYRPSWMPSSQSGNGNGKCLALRSISLRTAEPRNC